MLKREIFNTLCPKCSCKKTLIKITKNSQYLICEKCKKLKSKALWFY